MEAWGLSNTATYFQTRGLTAYRMESSVYLVFDDVSILTRHQVPTEALAHTEWNDRNDGYDGHIGTSWTASSFEL